MDIFPKPGEYVSCNVLFKKHQDPLRGEEWTPLNLQGAIIEHPETGGPGIPRHSMYAIYAYIGVGLGVNGAAYMAVPWSAWDRFLNSANPSPRRRRLAR